MDSQHLIGIFWLVVEFLWGLVDKYYCEIDLYRKKIRI